MFSNCLSKIMQSHIGCICLIFSNVSSNGLPASMHIHTDCICLIFSIVWFQMSPQIVWVRACKSTLVAIVSLSTVCIQMLLQTASLDVFSKWLLRRMHYHSNCTFLNCVFNVSSTCMAGRMWSHTDCICLFSTVGFKCPLKLLSSMWVCQMCPQISCLKGCNTTSAAVSWPFPMIYFFNMYPQNNSPRGCIVTIIAFFKTFPTFCFDTSPKMTCLSRLSEIYNCTCCICLTFLQCVWESSNGLHEKNQIQIQIWCIC